MVKVIKDEELLIMIDACKTFEELNNLYKNQPHVENFLLNSIIEQLLSKVKQKITEQY